MKFWSETGSVGKILKKNHYGGFYVQWTYGRNVMGEPLLSSVGSCRPEELRLVSRSDYQRVYDGPAWMEHVSLSQSRALPCEAFE